MSRGFVYFIEEEETKRIKIGFSEKHPEGRLKDFQTGNSNKLVLKGYIEGTYEVEARLHNEFSKERIRNQNEWFENSPRLKERIRILLEQSVIEKEESISNFENKSNPSFVEEFNKVVKLYDYYEGTLRYEGEIINGYHVGERLEGTYHGHGKEWQTAYPGWQEYPP
mgnify:FL=1